MANTDAPSGFAPTLSIYGGTIRHNWVRNLASGTNTSIFSGDVITLSSGCVTQAGATDTPIGVFYRSISLQQRIGTPTFSKVRGQEAQLLKVVLTPKQLYTVTHGIVYEAPITAGTHAVSFVSNKYASTTLVVH